MKYLYISLCITKPFLHLQSSLCVLFPYVYIAWLLFVLYTVYGLCNSCIFESICTYHMNFTYGRLCGVVICACGFFVGGPGGASPWARVAFGWALWLRTGLLEPNLQQVTVHGCWAGSAGGCRVGRCRVFVGAVCCTCGRVNVANAMFYFLYFIMSHYIYTQRVYYICMSYYISTQRVYYFCSFYDILVHIGTVYLCSIGGHILALG